MEYSTLGFIAGVLISLFIIFIASTFSTPLPEESKWIIFMTSIISGFCIGWVLEKIKYLQK